MKHLPGLLIVFFFLLHSCDIPYDDARIEIEATLPVNTNFELISDTLLVTYDPGMNAWFELYEGDHIAIAEFCSETIAGHETTWIKIANSQDKQGWVTHRELMWHFVPTDSISQLIHFLSDVDFVAYLATIVFALFILMAYFGMKKRIYFIMFNNIDSVYPLLLCLLASTCAVFYQSVQIFTLPDWLHYYFVPSLSPSGQPALLRGFLLSMWAILIAGIAVVDITFKQLSSGFALVYLLGLIVSCVFCYLFFLFTTAVYVGYYIYAVLLIYFLYRVIRETIYRFRCGHCGQKMKKRGECPRCGIVNK